MILTVHRIRTCAILVSALSAIPGRAAPCENLTALTIPSTSIATATAIPAGPFSPGASAGRGGATARPFPAFCRVTAVARPVADSEIHI
jgi:hypothetical protein